MYRTLNCGVGMVVCVAADQVDSCLALLQQRLESEQYPFRLVNASISGDTSARARARLPGALDRYRPDIVILQARDPQEALRLKPVRLHVIRRGRVIAETSPVLSRLEMADQTIEVDFRWPK